MQIAFLGIGAMGDGMARNLLKAGHKVTAFNRTKNRADALQTDGALVASSAAEACQNAEIVISMLADDDATQEVFLAEPNFLRSLQPGAVHCSMATISVELAERLIRAHDKAKRGYVSAPVFGRPPAAAAAQLFIIAAGKSGAISRCKPLFDAIGQQTFVVGKNPVVANIVKISGNFMLAALIETLGEAFALTRKYDVDPEQFLEIITNTIFPAPAYKNYGGMIARDNYEPPGFKLRLGLKDVGLALSAAQAKTVPMPIASLCRDHYLTAMARGYQEMDWAALGRICAENAGIQTKS